MRKLLMLFAIGLTLMSFSLNAQSTKTDTTLPKRWVRECRENVVFLLKAIDVKDSLLSVRLRTIRSFQESNDILNQSLIDTQVKLDKLRASLQQEQLAHGRTNLKLSKARKNRKLYAIAGFGSGILLTLLVKPP